MPRVARGKLGQGRNRPYAPQETLHAKEKAGVRIEVEGGYFYSAAQFFTKYNMEPDNSEKVWLNSIDKRISKHSPMDRQGWHRPDDGRPNPLGVLKVIGFAESGMEKDMQLASTETHTNDHFDEVVAVAAEGCKADLVAASSADDSSSESSSSKKAKKKRQSEGHASTASSFDWSGGASSIAKAKGSSANEKKKDKKDKKDGKAGKDKKDQTDARDKKKDKKTDPKETEKKAQKDSKDKKKQKKKKKKDKKDPKEKKKNDKKNPKVAKRTAQSLSDPKGAAGLTAPQRQTKGRRLHNIAHFDLDVQKQIDEYTNGLMKCGKIAKLRNLAEKAEANVADSEWWEVMVDPEGRILVEAHDHKEKVGKQSAKLRAFADFQEACAATKEKPCSEDGANVYNSGVLQVRVQALKDQGFDLDNRSISQLLYRFMDEYWEVQCFDLGRQLLEGDSAESSLKGVNAFPESVREEGRTNCLMTYISKLLWEEENEAAAVSALDSCSKIIGLVDSMKNLLVAMKTVMEWKATKGSEGSLKRFEKARETLRTSAKVSRQFTNCTHSATLIASLDKYILDAEAMVVDKKKLQNLKSKYESSSEMCEVYNSQMIILVGRLRVEFTGVVVNAASEFHMHAAQEIEATNAILESKVDVIEVWALDVWKTQLAAMAGLAIKHKDDHKDTAKGEESRKNCLVMLDALKAIETQTTASKTLLADHAKVAHQKRHDEFKTSLSSFQKIVDTLAKVPSLLFYSHGEATGKACIRAPKVQDVIAIKTLLDTEGPVFLALGKLTLNGGARIQECWIDFGSAVFGAVEAMTRSEIAKVVAMPEVNVVCSVGSKLLALVNGKDCPVAAATEENPDGPMQFLKSVVAPTGALGKHLLDTGVSSISVASVSLQTIVQHLSGLPERCALRNDKIDFGQGIKIGYTELSLMAPMAKLVARLLEIFNFTQLKHSNVPKADVAESMRSFNNKAKSLCENMRLAISSLLKIRQESKHEFPDSYITQLGSVHIIIKNWLKGLVKHMLPLKVIKDVFVENDDLFRSYNAVLELAPDTEVPFDKIRASRKSPGGKLLFQSTLVCDKVWQELELFEEDFKGYNVYALLGDECKYQDIVILKKAVELKSMFAAQQMLRTPLKDGEPRRAAPCHHSWCAVGVPAAPNQSKENKLEFVCVCVCV